MPLVYPHPEKPPIDCPGHRRRVGGVARAVGQAFRRREDSRPSRASVRDDRRGDESAPEPFSLFLASIGTCAGIYVKYFCEKRGIDASKIKIIQRHNFNPETRLIDRIELEAILPDDFPDKYRSAVVNAMDLCAVKRHLNNPPEIKTITNYDR